MSLVEERLAPADARRAMPDARRAMPEARRAMIDSQLRTSGVNALAVLNAFNTVARETFVSADRRAVAYADRAVPLDGARVLAPAVTHGQMLEAAATRTEDRALLIGGGTGYLAALLMQLVGSLTVVEDDAALLAATPERSGEWHEGPLTAGWAAAAPYSLIVIDGAIEQLPQAIADQLAPDGRIITGLIQRGVARLAEGRKSGGAGPNGAGGGVAFAALGEADFAVLAAFAAEKKWSF
ncbi:protein-L-isoaspartate O-methyltransferase [Novosphingobium sp.]|uniref:protein-L-isoaspartate O-methyltransferase family protein n=1 Tax=Novosphingobium sp. TaxID=1874826 RepID=UPI0025E9A1EC|nr:protein-L-isoaspartate O-methyltransferase [Novosphingobium sp.]